MANAIQKTFACEVVGSSPEEALRNYQEEVKFWVDAAKLTGYKPQ